MQPSWKQSRLAQSKHKSICGRCISRVGPRGRMQSKCKCVTVAMIWNKLSCWYKRSRGSMRILTHALMPIHFTGQLFKLQDGKVLFPGYENCVKHYKKRGNFLAQSFLFS